MYTATMVYNFKENMFDEACELWEKKVFVLAQNQKGFVRMQFLAAPPKAMAIGTWENEEDAKAFMQTGVFKHLMDDLEGMLSSDPQPQIWDLKHFAEAT